MPDLRISVDIDASGTAKGAAEAKAAIRGVGDEAERTRKRSVSLLDIDFKAVAERIKSLRENLRNMGQQMQQAGRSMSIAITAPLTALATLGIRAALELDTAQTKIRALVGSAEEADKKIIELRQLAARSVGVTQKAALETYAQLKGIGGIADESINRIIAAMGRLNAAFTIDNQPQFMRNLVQLFTQGFERQDIKEALGRVPIFEQLMEQAFGTKDPKKLNALKKAGKLTLDNWLQGLAEAIQNDPRTANVEESLTVHLTKAFEKLNVALAPLGKSLLDVLMPLLDRLAPVVETISRWFDALSPAVKESAVAIGGLLAVLGPLLIIAGSVVTAISALVGAIGTIAGAVGGAYGILGIGVLLAGLAAAFAPVIAWIGLLWAAWQTNFGQIRELTAVVVAGIEEAWNAMMAALSDLTQSVLAEVKAFWQQNGDDILALVKAFSEAFREIWQAIVAFWKENHETIKEVASAAWLLIKAVVVETVRIIGDVIQVWLGVLTLDWRKTWNGLVDIVKAAFIALVALAYAQGELLLNAVKLMFQGVWNLANWITAETVKLGVALVQGFIQGIRAQVDAVIGAARWLGTRAIEALREELKIHSPSQVMHEIGVHVAQGLADGINANAPAVGAAATSLSQLLGGDLRDVISRTLDVLTDGSRSWGDRLKTVFGGIAQNFRKMANDMISTWLAALFHIGGGQGQGRGGTPYFNPNGGISGPGGGWDIFNGGGRGVPLGSDVPPTGTIDANGNYTVNGNQVGGIGAIFGKGGIFGSQGFGNNVGTYGGIGALANIAGGLIGGRVGSYVSNIGSGLAAGAMIGTWILPGIGTAIGAAIGAAAGFFSTLFGGDPKYKKDKKENLPQLTQGVTDALQQLRQLVVDIKSLRVSPDQGLAKAIELRGQIAAGFGIQFQSKKGQKQAQQIIAQRLTEADSLLAQIRDAADIARAAGERERRMLPEFAGGVYMSPAFQAFRRRNGFLGGAWTGRDTIPAMLAAGEMVLNPMQQARVRAQAGGDVFRSAGIPGYAGGGMVQAGGDIANNITVNVVQDSQGIWHATAESDAGQRTIARVVERKYANDEIKLKRRGA